MKKLFLFSSLVLFIIINTSFKEDWGFFAHQMINMMKGNSGVEAVVIVPTRELAMQVSDELFRFGKSSGMNTATVYGGQSYSMQLKNIDRASIIVATPGRLIDLLKGKKINIKPSFVVLDEADEMLNMGFIEDIEFVLASSAEQRRVYLFSATMPQRIKQLSKKYMNDQTIIEVKKKQEANPLIEQTFVKIKQSEKFDALTQIIEIQDFFYGIIFCRTKADVDNVTQGLKKMKMDVDCIHGDVPQNKREKILQKFRDLKLSILVATDVAARGIDVENLSHVINYNLPEDVETYTHRIGRTGRAGNKGQAISLCSNPEMRRITQIEKTLKTKLSPFKLPSKKELVAHKSKKMTVEIDGVIENIDTSHHIPLADQLLAKHDPLKVVTALLHQASHASNASQKGSQENSRSSRSRDSHGDTLRLFVAKGRMDKMDRKGLIRFLERETRTKLGDISDVKVCEKFSFLTLDADEAHMIVEHFEAQGRRRPLAEIAN